MPETNYSPESIDAQLLEPPKNYCIILWNDDFTDADFVKTLLINLFGHTSSNAESLVIHIHQHQKAVVATYPKDIAETRAAQATQLSKMYEFPLKVEVQEAG